jgi:AcrR family transcriptional regulator
MANTSESHQERKQEIIRASAELFDRVGYHGASMQMIADAVNLGKPTLYHYFKSKSAILFAMHQELVSELLESHRQRAEQSMESASLLRGLCYDTLAFIKNNPGYVRAFFEHYQDLDAGQQDALQVQRRGYLKMVINIIRAGIDDGSFAPCNPRIAALGFLGMCTWAYQWLPRDQSPADLQIIADELSTMILKGLTRSSSV